ncbi:MAG: hypothetical protein HY808_00650 [Nitrospirae bacterium]|nr:hypothetical protein [Nitrospirota bacterium]
MKKGIIKFGWFENLVSVLFAALLALSLVACGGGGGGGGGSDSGSNSNLSDTGKSDTTANIPPPATNDNNNNPVAVSTLTGVAATGAPMSGGNVYLKEANGTEHGPYPIDANGNYSIDVTGLTPPFYLKAERTVGGVTTTLYSVSMGSGIGNINPLTNLAVAAASGVNNPADAYNDPGSHSITQPNLDKAITDIETMLAPILAAYNASNINPFTDGNYKADGSGLDGVVDDMNLDIDITNGIVTIRLKSDPTPLGQAHLNNLGSPDDPITGAEVTAALASKTALGTGYNFPPLVRADLTLNVNEASLGTSSLTYSFNGMVLVSTSITTATISAGTAAIEGTGSLEDGSTCQFTAIVTNGGVGSGGAMGIVIFDSTGTIHSTASQAINGGLYTVGDGSVSGTGNNFPPLNKADLTVNVDSLLLSAGHLTYSFNGMNFISTSITEVTVTAGTATIKGDGLLEDGLTCQFTATVTNGEAGSGAMGIVITAATGIIHNAATQTITVGKFTVTP